LLAYSSLEFLRVKYAQLYVLLANAIRDVEKWDGCPLLVGPASSSIKEKTMTSHKNEGFEKVEVEKIPKEQAQKEKSELQHAAQKAKQTSKGTGSQEKDELDDVEAIPKEQAEKEIQEAARKVKKEDKRG
jgi:hypothetical protein